MKYAQTTFCHFEEHGSKNNDGTKRFLLGKEIENDTNYSTNHKDDVEDVSNPDEKIARLIAISSESSQIFCTHISCNILSYKTQIYRSLGVNYG